ncbi:U4/U6-U5 snRNP complex subunit prp38, partial [Quaeritorhiza haematococci]
MANRTVSDAKTVHGTNPQFLIEKIIRTRIYDSLYWKEECFGLTAESLIDKGVSLNAIGGQFGNQKPTQFLCLTLKLLQLQPEMEIVTLYIQQEDYKYLRALGAFYLRLTGRPVDVYKYLEPLLYDKRKLRVRTPTGYTLTHMDEFIDDLLRLDRVCDTILPRITKRQVLEEVGDLHPRVSILEEELEDEELKGLLEEKEGSDG